jgi:hypothetical protein
LSAASHGVPGAISLQPGGPSPRHTVVLWFAPAMPAERHDIARQIGIERHQPAHDGTPSECMMMYLLRAGVGLDGLDEAARSTTLSSSSRWPPFASMSGFCAM